MGLEASGRVEYLLTLLLQDQCVIVSFDENMVELVKDYYVLTFVVC